MDRTLREQIALHRWAVIAEAAGQNLTAREQGALVRQIAARSHAHPDGSPRTYSRGTIDRWLRPWRRGGMDALRPAERSDTGWCGPPGELGLVCAVAGHFAVHAARDSTVRAG